MRYGFGVDIFGSQTKLGCFNERGELLHKWKIDTPILQGGNQILPLIAGEIEEYMNRNHIFEDDVIGIGVGIPGPVNSSGVVNKCVNFGWGVFNIDRALSGITGLRVKSGNIATLAALGECWKGSGTKDMVFVAMNTGLGGAVVCNGQVVRGAHGGGGEFGHMVVNKNERSACTCGRKGCVEQYCSPAGILRVAKQHLTGTLNFSSLRKQQLTDYSQVVRAAESGDKVAQEVMNEVYDHAGHFLANVCCVTNPDTIVLGGEFCHIGQSALNGVSKAFHKYIFHANENVRFEFAKLGTDACLYGAFKTVLDADQA